MRGVRQELFCDYVRSAVRRELFVRATASEDCEVVRAEARLLLAAKERLQDHVRRLGRSLPSALRDEILRNLLVSELAGYDDLTVCERADALVALLRAEGLSAV